MTFVFVVVAVVWDFESHPHEDNNKKKKLNKVFTQNSSY